jgi:hypothetical protein
MRTLLPVPISFLPLTSHRPTSHLSPFPLLTSHPDSRYTFSMTSGLLFDFNGVIVDDE